MSPKPDRKEETMSVLAPRLCVAERLAVQALVFSFNSTAHWL